MKNIPFKQRFLFAIGLLSLCTALLLKYFLTALHVDFLSGFLVGFGIIMTIAGFVKIQRWRKTTASQ